MPLAAFVETHPCIPTYCCFLNFVLFVFSVFPSQAILQRRLINGGLLLSVLPLTFIGVVLSLNVFSASVRAAFVPVLGACLLGLSMAKLWMELSVSRSVLQLRCHHIACRFAVAVCCVHYSFHSALRTLRPPSQLSDWLYGSAVEACRLSMCRHVYYTDNVLYVQVFSRLFRPEYSWPWSVSRYMIPCFLSYCFDPTNPQPTCDVTRTTHAKIQAQTSIFCRTAGTNSLFERLKMVSVTAQARGNG